MNSMHVQRSRSSSRLTKSLPTWLTGFAAKGDPVVANHIAMLLLLSDDFKMITVIRARLRMSGRERDWSSSGIKRLRLSHRRLVPNRNASRCH